MHAPADRLRLLWRRWGSTALFLLALLAMASITFAIGSTAHAVSALFGGLIFTAFLARNRRHLAGVSFTPWREDFVASVALAAFAVFAPLAVATGPAGVGITVIGWLGALLVSAVCLILAFVAFTVGVNRWHSTNLEGWAVDRLSANFSSLKADCFTNMEIPDVGRLDFAVETAKGLAVVQVEPWSCWKPDGEAEAAAAEEAARLAEYLTPTFMVIWLPRGRPSLRQRFLKPRAGGVPVIFGGERMVVRPILKLNKVNIRESIPRLRR